MQRENETIRKYQTSERERERERETKKERQSDVESIWV